MHARRFRRPDSTSMASSKLVLPKEETKEEEDEKKREVEEFRNSFYDFYATVEQKVYEEKMQKKREKEERIRKRIKDAGLNAYLQGFQDAEKFYKNEVAEARAYWDHLGQSSEEEGVAEVKRRRAATAASKEALGGGGGSAISSGSNGTG